MVAIRESHHIAGQAAAYLEPAAAQGCKMLWACSDPSECSVAPFGGLRALFTIRSRSAPDCGRSDPIDMSAPITPNGMTGRLRREGRRFGRPVGDHRRRRADPLPGVLFGDPPGTLLRLRRKHGSGRVDCG